ncbi:sensor histidine kinase [Plantactinospora sp. CA-290183]|uniref:sensor histidine kinase n=1 Tax=Plantactinospora sp. CA-290183 TaxID=3240006 RepID=UPI003D8CC566
MIPGTLWSALAGPPLRLMRSAWPWRALAYLLGDAALGVAVLVALAALAALGLTTMPLLLGVPVVIATLLIGLPVAGVERRLLRLIRPGQGSANPHRTPSRPGLWVWTTTRLREGHTWRELGYALLLAGPLWALDLVIVGGPLLVGGTLLAAPLLVGTDLAGMVVLRELAVMDSLGKAWFATAAGVPVLLLWLYLVTAYAGARSALSRVLLVPDEAVLRSELVQVSRSRARLVDAFEAERRRIERDLHDGAQQQLLGVSVTLGLARLEAAEAGAGRDLVDRIEQAHDQARQAMADLRALIHGIHPQVLTDRGLPAAIAAAVDRLPVPVTVDVDLPRRLPPAVESAGYFAVCEAFANIAKHSRAGDARVRAGLDGDRLVIEVHDDGVGGARTRPGSGLAGLADRLAVVAGTILLSSPPGGPTLVRLEIPCTPDHSCE